MTMHRGYASISSCTSAPAAVLSCCLVAILGTCLFVLSVGGDGRSTISALYLLIIYMIRCREEHNPIFPLLVRLFRVYLRCKNNIIFTLPAGTAVVPPSS